MTISISTEGFISGASSGSSPVFTTVSSPSVASDPLVITVYGGALSFYHVTCQDHADGPRFTVWDPHDSFFSFPFDNNRSTVTGTGVSTDPYIFTIYRLGGWPTGIELDVRIRAVDAGTEGDN